jgi:hypothetical protein
LTLLPGPAASEFDYGAPAGVFTRSSHGRRGGSARYRRFETAAEAIRYAIEELPAPLLPGITMEVGEDSYDHLGILRLYDDPRFPRSDAKRGDDAAE